MTSDAITLFDIPTKERRCCWSPNVWKARLVLNYKGLDYKTEWIEYPDIAPLLENHVRPHNVKPPQALYTLPAIRLPDGTYFMDSRNIAATLEERYPATPSLHLDSPLLPRVEAAMNGFLSHLRAVFIAQVPHRLLSESSQRFWKETRTARCGGSTPEQVEAADGGEKAFAAAEPALRELTSLLGGGGKESAGEDGPSGPFVMGAQASYADFLWAAYLLFFRELGDDLFQPLLERTGNPEAHLRLLDAVSEWSKRRDY